MKVFVLRVFPMDIKIEAEILGIFDSLENAKSYAGKYDLSLDDEAWKLDFEAYTQQVGDDFYDLYTICDFEINPEYKEENPKEVNPVEKR